MSDFAVFEDGAEVPVEVTVVDGQMRFEVRDADGMLYGGLSEPDATERDLGDLLYSVCVFVVEKLRGRPVVRGFSDAEWLRRCEQIYLSRERLWAA